MEATQAFELDSDTAEPGSSGAAEVGCLTVEYPDRAPDAFPLFTGANVVGRSSSEPDRDRELLDGWQEEGVVQCVHGIPLHSNSISAQHAVLYLEGNGAFCFIKDLKSRNKTQIERQGNKIQLASDDRYGLSSGDTIRFGALSCRVTFAPAAERPGLPGAADLATQAYGLVGDEDDKENSPTGDTPAAVAASGAGASESGQGHPDQPLPTTAAQLLPPAGGTAQLMEGSYFPTQGPGKSGAASGNPSASASWKTKRAHAVESDAATETKGKAVAADLLPEEPGNSCVARAKPASPAKSYIKPPVEHQGIESGWRSKAGAAESQLPAEKGPPATGGRAGGKKRKATQEADVADEATQDEAGPSDRRQLRKIETREVRVLFSTCVDASLRKAYTKTIQRLGGSVAADSDQSFTHFLTLQAARGESDRGFKKSLNTLMALAAGRPIVAESWMDACTRSNAFVDPKDHLLQDSAAEKKLGFVLQTSYERAQHQLLLTGLHVFFTPGLLSAESDKGAGLRSLVTLAGGTVAASLDKDLSGDNAAMLGSWLVVGSEKDLGKERKWAQGKLKGGVPVHSRSMLVDSIMQQSLDRSAGVLFVS
ncbi:hypothetical protein WJX72_007535 [[Myrmecia] bisecta]|uniref:Mediator of DNA damage checkpoint protein 1 n=1 Tax=[Myrmecia] bisecta TaxID=41462 RepID=A0AAW1QSK3_9CHLO